jgi:hypothetical protein
MMAVVNVTTLTVKPDRFEDYVDLVRKVKAITARNGGRNVRLLAALVAGEVTGSLAFTYEADDFAAMGAMGDKLMADPEGLAVMSTLNTSSSPVAGYQSSYWVDVPL